MSFLVIGIVLLLAVWAISQSKPKSKLEPMVPYIMFGILETTDSGIRSWFTPFDIETKEEAASEAVKGILNPQNRDIKFLTVFAQSGADEPFPVFTIGSPDHD